MHWPVLIFASLFEAFIPILVIRSDSYTHLLYTSALVATVVCSILGLRYAMAVIPLGIAYLVWTSLGILGSVTIGAEVLHEHISGVEMASLALIVVAVIGLRISSGSTQTD